MWNINIKVLKPSAVIFDICRVPEQQCGR